MRAIYITIERRNPLNGERVFVIESVTTGQNSGMAAMFLIRSISGVETLRLSSEVLKASHNPQAWHYEFTQGIWKFTLAMKAKPPLTTDSDEFFNAMVI